MSRFRSLMVSAAVLGLVGAGLTGCAADAEGNEAAACEGYAAFTAAVSDAQETLAGTPTVGEIREARDEIRSSYEVLKGSITSVAADRQQALQDSIEELNDAVNDVDADMTIPEAVQSLSDEFGDIQAAELAVSTELSC